LIINEDDDLPKYVVLVGKIAHAVWPASSG
jgi:hypothetical protein